MGGSFASGQHTITLENGEHGFVLIEGVEVKARRPTLNQFPSKQGRVLDTDFALTYFGRFDLKLDRQLGRQLLTGQREYASQSGWARDGHDPGQDGELDSGLPGALDEAEVEVCVEEQLRDREIRTGGLLCEQSVNVLRRRPGTRVPGSAVAPAVGMGPDGND